MNPADLTWDPAAEQSVLGSILLSPACLPTVERSLRPADFRLASDRAVYEAVLSLERAGGSVDPVTVLDQTAKMGAPVSREYLFGLMELAATAANVEEHVRIVREDVLRSGLMELAETVHSRVTNRTPVAEALAQARQTLDKLERQGSAGRLATPTDILTAFYRQREAVESGDGKAYVCTGYMALDSLLGGGLINSGLYLLAARPGMGKTTLALNIADRVAKADPVLFKRRQAEASVETLKRSLEERAKTEKKAVLGADKDLAQFELLFQQAQETANKMHGILLKVRSRDEDAAGRLVKALQALAEAVGRCAE